MKKFVFLVLVFLASFTASAQNLCKGTVIDKDGNPVAQAKVEVVGTEISCLTDLDGVFRIEMPTNLNMLKVEYLGMSPKTVKATSNMTIIMHKAKRFGGSLYDEPQVIFGLQGMTSMSKGITPAMGYTIGQVKEIGWYAKGIWGLASESVDIATIGSMVHLGTRSPIYLYLGGGVMLGKDALCPTIDAGLMFRMKKAFINVGAINGKKSLNMNIGIGCFL